MIKRNLIILIQWLAATFILLHPALWNRFPLVNSDTGTYLSMAYSRIAAADRPVFYGLFIKCTALYGSLWSVIIIQNLLLAITLWCFLKKFFQDFSSFNYFLIIIILSYTTSISLFSCQIMTDVFTPLLILSSFILLFGETSIPEKIFFSVLFMLSSVVHYSNLMLIFAIFILLVLIQYFFFRKDALLTLKVITAFSVLLLLTCFITPLRNYQKEGKFYYSHYNGIMLAGKLIETGIFKTYLNETCSTNHYAICDYKDVLPSMHPSFLYNSDSPLNSSLGGWDKADKELSIVCKNAIIKHPLLFITTSLECSASNLFRFNVGSGINPYMPGTSVHDQILYFYNDQFNRWSTSRQQFDQLNFDLLRIIQDIFICFSLAFILILLLYKKFREEIPLTTKYFFLTVLSAFILNALITGTLASAHDDRYQTRLAWLACLPFLFYIVPILERKIFNWVKELIKAGISS
ncbi:hypothetical protein LBMAG27_08620 [Bacteroidota bacterium]|nr:hypothetical protein LBMAG27_08620 [Bacteroidota bacterium]